MTLCRQLLCVLYVILVCAKVSSSDETQKTQIKSGKCKGMWRPEPLPGRCFGLKLHHTYEELRHIKSVNSSTKCKALCCSLGDKCASWQYEHYSKECKLGWILRLGTEAAGVPGWCEPIAPIKWNGQKILSRDNGVCKFGDELAVQCFGLGNERLAADGSRMTTTQCAEACCASSSCNIWQEGPGKGCFYSSINDVGCDDKSRAKYEGGRKCLIGYCGGMEKDLIVSGNGTISAALRGQ